MEQELRRLAGQRIRAQEDERARIASELHDGIGQSLSAIKFAMENLLYELPDGTQEHFRQRLQRTIASARASIEEVRRISMDLRPSTLDDLGLIATIGWFCREFGEIFPDLQIEKRIEVAESEVPETLKLDIFRILQESMNNAAKYAGASRLRVSLARRDGELALCIEDNGSGFDVAAVLDSSLTFGLRGMRQRAECSDGGLNISANTDGTRIVVAWRVA
jgi:signal transduction histidine kinase